MAYGSLPARRRPSKSKNRSVSNPPPSNDFGTLPLDRHNSFDSAVQLQESGTKRGHGLPSIRALRERFQSFAKRSTEGFGKGDGSSKSGDSPRKLVKRIGTGRETEQGKGGSGVSEKVESYEGIVKSASLPILGSRSRIGGHQVEPLPSANARASVDAFLATSSSKRSTLAPLPSADRLPRTPSISLGPRRPQTSDALSPMSQPLPVFNRISSDFARSAAAPSLSALRAPQYRETATLNRTKSSPKRHSRILPGATLPTTFPEADSDRPPSSLLRAHSAKDARVPEQQLETPSQQRREFARAPSIDAANRRRSSVLSNELPRFEERLKDDLAYRRHSLSPVIASATNSSPDETPSHRGQDKTPESLRGKALSTFIGAARRTSSGVGLGLTSTDGEGRGGLDKRRPSKPFPGGFVEVPYQATTSDGSMTTSLGGPRKTLKAISIAPRQSGDSPAFGPMPTSPTDSPPAHVQQTPSSPTAFPSSLVNMVSNAPTMIRPIRRRPSSADVEEGTVLPPLSNLEGTPGLRRSQSEGKLRLAVRDIDGDGTVAESFGIGGGKSEGASIVGGYSARLAELRALRTPVLEGEKKRNSQFEAVESVAPTSALEAAQAEEDQDESRPVSPTHFTNSPGSQHPFRLSTYLDYLPLTHPLEPHLTALPPIDSAQAAQSDEMVHAEGGGRNERNLSLAEMEHEISKMERELALAGTPRSFFTDDGQPEAALSLSSDGPCGLRLPTSAPQSTVMDSPSLTDHLVTPRTARKWSIVEVERAYERMKRLLGSSSSSRMYTPSDAGRDSQVDISQEDIGEGLAVETRVEGKGETGPLGQVEDQLDVFSSISSGSRDTLRLEHSPSPLGARPPSSTSPTLTLKPLPGIPSSSPSPRRSPADDVSYGTSTHRRLVLPTRVRSKTSIDDFSTMMEDGPSNAGGRSRSVEPLSPARSGGRRSRLEDTGPLRSGVGKEIQRRATGALSPSASPTSPSHRIAVHRLVRPFGGSRRRESARVSEGSWFPTTPRRTVGPSRSMGDDSSSFRLDRIDALSDNDSDSEATSTSTARPELLEVRNLDKLQIFFMYTSVKAELAKTQVERDALFDALRETRTSLGDVRRQRDACEAELKQEKLFSSEVKKHLGGEHEYDIYFERLENLIQSRSAWQSRAQEALEELEQAKSNIVRLEREISKGSNPASDVVVPQPTTSPLGSPTFLTVVAPVSLPTERHASRQRRTISTHSNGSSVAGLGTLDELEYGSPLLSQKFRFASKDSDSSIPHHSILPFPRLSPPTSHRKASTATTHSTWGYEEEEERSFDSVSSAPGPDLEGLKEKDQAFLENLTSDTNLDR